MSSLRSSLLTCVLFFAQAGTFAHNQINADQISQIQHHAQLWVNTFIQPMTPAQMNITANIIHILYTNGLLDHKVRTYLSPFCQLSRSINSQAFSYQFPHNDLVALSALVERLSKLTFTRAFYNTTLAECEKFLDQHEESFEFKPILEAIDVLQFFGQDSLAHWATTQNVESTKNYASTSQVLDEQSVIIHHCGQFYKQLEQKSLTFDVQESDRDLAALETAKNVSFQLIEHMGKITDALNVTNDQVNDLISFGTEIYRYHYEAIYNLMTSMHSPENKHRQIFFGPNGILPINQRILELPHPDDALDQAIKTASFYTAKKIINQ